MYWSGLPLWVTNQDHSAAESQLELEFVCLHVFIPEGAQTKCIGWEVFWLQITCYSTCTFVQMYSVEWKKLCSDGSLKQTNKQTNKQTDKQTYKQTNKQTNNSFSSLGTCLVHSGSHFLSQSLIHGCYLVMENSVQYNVKVQRNFPEFHLS